MSQSLILSAKSTPTISFDLSIALEARMHACLKHLSKSLPLAQATLHLYSETNSTQKRKYDIFQRFVEVLKLHQKPPVIIKIIDPLKEVKASLQNPEYALFYTQRDYQTPFESLISLKTIRKVASYVFPHLQEFYYAHFNTGDLSLLNLSDFQFLVKKNTDMTELYALLPYKMYQGGFKEIYLALKISKTFKAFAFSKTKDIPSFYQEIALRSNKALSPMIPRLVMSWMGQSVDQAHINGYMITPWANQGTLKKFLEKPLSLEEKDNLALQLLYKMTIFHAHGVHKDLKLDNLLVHEVRGQYHLFINDVGCGFLFDNPQSVNLVFSRPHHLSPEIIRMLMQQGKNFGARRALKSSCSETDWLYAERFQVGHILAQIYLGHSPFVLIQNRTDVLAEYPIGHYSFEELIENPELLYQLEPFMEDGDKDYLEELYKQPFESFYNQIPYFPGAPYKKPPNQEEFEDDQSEENSELIAEKYDAYFESYFLDHKKRSLLESFFNERELAESEKIYKSAYETMQTRKHEALNLHLARTIAAIEDEVEEFFPNIDSILDGRLSAVFKLLSLDPLNRPGFEEVFDDILEIIQASYISAAPTSS